MHAAIIYFKEVSVLFPDAECVVAVREVEGDHPIAGAHQVLDVIACLVD
jgi:hypothetical protein